MSQVVTRPVDRVEILRLLTERLPEFRSHFGVGRIGLFGSFVRGEEDETSDIDILVVFDHATYRGYMGLKAFLEEHLGRTADLVSDQALKPRMRDSILRETVYASES